MFSRRDLIKSAASLVAVPTAAAVAAGEPTPPRAKADREGVVRLSLPVGYAGDGAERVYYAIAVEIMPLERWRAMGRDINEDGSFTGPKAQDDDHWSARLLEDDRVLGVRLEVKDWNTFFVEERAYESKPDPEAAAQLRRMRNKFIATIEDDPEAGGISVDYLGNGKSIVRFGPDLIAIFAADMME